MFPDVLKRLRKASKINQTILAEHLSVTQSAIATWECGKRQPDFDMLCRIADYFGVTTDCLLGRTPIPVPPEPPPPQDPPPPQAAAGLETIIREVVRQELEKRGL